MAETRIIRIQEPGTTSFYNVTMTETSRTEVTSQTRVSEIIKTLLLAQQLQATTDFIFTDSEAQTIANAAAASLSSSGYI